MTVALIVFISLAVFLLLKLVHKTLQRVMGYKWWYRNIYLWTPHWRFTRKVKLFFSGYQCARCTRIKLDDWQIRNHSLDIHHKTYKHLWWEWLFLWDLMVLCRYHHSREHARKGS